MAPGSADREKIPPRWAVVWGVAVALVAGVFYVVSLAPTVLPYDTPYTLDSPMLQAAVPVLGVGHPTGYPTYMMLTHLFTYLPFGDVAYRVNLASAAYGVLAVSAVYAACLALCRRVVASAAGALAFGLSGAFWSQAVIAEVYTLNALFVALVLFLLLLWRERRDDRVLLAAASVAGLSLTHHLSSAMLIPAGLLFVALADRTVLLRGGALPRGLGAFALGLLPLVYLPVRAAMGAPLNEADPSIPGRFLELVTGGSFLAESSEAGRECVPSALALEGPAAKLASFSREVFVQFPLAFLALGVFGALYFLFRDRAVAALLGLVFFGSFLHGLAYRWLGIEDFSAFLIPGLLVLAVCASAGLGLLFRPLENLTDLPARLLPVALSAAVLAMPLLGAWIAYGGADRSGAYEGRRAIEAVVRNADRNATILHHRSPLWYMVLVEERRQDLTLVDPFCTSWNRRTDLVWPDDLTAAQSAHRYETDDTTGVEAARKAAARGSVYVLDHGRVDYERFRAAGFEAEPAGGGRFLYELVPR
ncbi:DUF2723 domain-containing protein [Rubrobacter tropicus]|uniref:DUF2723 domain-containing protein n=1 Tax=Rubrobacter tropicus TaxID=2653851 RepID=A0A6G8QBI8_9ACTN|nr:DUF2723 domain-containing protein [Rubrobacter tropicus]QIN83864.1 DUF2723 domain-containing protein [Rubrobacter tropicus]